MLENNIFSQLIKTQLRTQSGLEDIMKYKRRVLQMLMLSVDSSRAGCFS